MTRVLKYLKPYVERRSPRLATIYRSVRDTLRSDGADQPSRTPHGFALIGDASMRMGTFEPDECAFVSEQLGTADVFVDVGANVGFYACLARQRGVHVVAIEPLPGNLARLYKNLELNSWADIEVFPMAVGAAPGLVSLYGDNTGASLIAGWAGSSLLMRRIVSVSTLDTIVGERFAGRRLLIKVDVEGAERVVLEGAQRLMASTPRPTWLVEVCLTEHHPDGLNPDFVRVFAMFWSCGYTARTVDSERRIVVEDDVIRWVQARQRGFGSHNFAFSAP